MLVIGLSAAISACSTVTIHPNSTQRLPSTPTFEERKPFYMWGLAGEHRVDVQQVCGEQQARQMQTQQTFTDGLLGLVTLGIYSPHSVKVWCQ